MKVVIASLFLTVFNFAPAASWPLKVFNFPAEYCDSVHSCADIHTARICRPTSDGRLKTFATVQCTPDRPYCDTKSGTCVSRDLARNIAKESGISDISCDRIFSCRDCNTAQICRPTVNGSYILYKHLPCTEDRPYCDQSSGTCVSQEPTRCGRGGEFTCAQDGKFPDLDCNSYHYCIGSESTTLQCTISDEHYNPKIGACDIRTPCESFSCKENIAKKIPHPLDHRYFAFCGHDGPVTIESCPEPYELNFTSQQCEATCHHNGLMQDLDDSRFYFKCTKVFTNTTHSYFIKDRKRCPEGDAFDPSEYLCMTEIPHIP